MLTLDLPKRKQIRLPTYDYSTAGAYFVTICAKDKKHLFGAIKAPNPAVGAAISRPPVPILSAIGKTVEASVLEIPKRYPSILVEKYAVMPNHVHLLLLFTPDADGRLIAAPTLSQVIGQMKRWCSKTVGHTIWQKSFYDHVIRNEADHLAVWQYIDENPQTWTADEFYCL